MREYGKYVVIGIVVFLAVCVLAELGTFDKVVSPPVVFVCRIGKEVTVLNKVQSVETSDNVHYKVIPFNGPPQQYWKSQFESCFTVDPSDFKQ